MPEERKKEKGWKDREQVLFRGATVHDLISDTPYNHHMKEKGIANKFSLISCINVVPNIVLFNKHLANYTVVRLEIYVGFFSLRYFGLSLNKLERNAEFN